MGNREQMTAAAQSKPSQEPAEPHPVRTADDLREKIEEVRRRVEKADKPTGPFGLFGLTTT